MHDTIAAIATALSPSAISIIRVSGPDAINIVNKIFTKNLFEQKSHTITYGYIKEKEEIIDEVLISIMKSPKSFTTEDVVEINCHGGIATTKKILELIILNGARMAEPGEFTKRRFLNGKIDLTESTAIQELISVKSEKARKIAMNNLKGQTNIKIKELRQKLRQIISNIEVNIDYPEYLDIEEMTKEQIRDSLSYIKESLDQIIKNSKNSRLIKEGINICLVGRPNVGKSSILNKLLNEEKAIVTSVAGTTRDIVEGTITIDGILLNFIDTAGIRKTNNIVEKIGVNKSLDIIKTSDLVILVLNNNEKLTDEDYSLLEETKNKKRIIVVNKDDLVKKIDIKEDAIYINTITVDGIKSLTDEIKRLFNLDKIDYDNFSYVSNIEQIKSLEEAKKSISTIEKGLNNDMPIDILEIDIKNIWNILGEIIGETYSEELLDNLFKDFCVGK